MKKVLWITPSIFPVSSGQAMHSLGYIRALSKFCELKIIAHATRKEYESFNSNSEEFRDFDITLSTAYRKQTVFNVLRQPIEKFFSHNAGVMVAYSNIIRCIEKITNQFQPEYIVIDYIGMYNYYRWAKRHFPEAKFIYISHNVEFKNFEDIRMMNKGNSWNNLYWIKKRKGFENELLRDCEASLCISKADIEILKKEFPDANNLVFAKPMIQFAPVKKMEDLIIFKKKLIIVGSMDWYPNVNGIVWFVENVFSKLIAIDQEFKLFLVGRKPSSMIMELGKKYSNNIIITGGVDSLDPYYKECDMAVIPVFEGTGAKIKVLEALGKRIPTVCADYSAKDYSIINGEMEVVPKDVDAFLTSIYRIASSLDYRKMMYDRMNDYVNSYYQINQEIIEIFREA